MQKQLEETNRTEEEECKRQVQEELELLIMWQKRALDQLQIQLASESKQLEEQIGIRFDLLYHRTVRT